MFSAELHARNVYPPIDPLSSLSRLMRKGAGPGRTRADHLNLAAQLLAALSRAHQIRELSELIGTATLSHTDRLYLEFEEVFRDHLLTQRPDEARELNDTLERAWQVLLHLPRRELAMFPAALLDAR